MNLNFHSALFSVGALVALAVYQRRTRALRPLADSSVDLLTVFLAGLLGARFAWALVFGATSLLDYVAFWRAGLISWGGLLTGSLTAWGRIRRDPNREQIWSDLLTAVLYGWTIGRLGNWLVGDAYGVELAGQAGRVPIQLFEANLTLGLAIWSGRPTARANDWWRVALIYGVGRILIDSWRDTPTVIWGLNGSQLAALALAVCATIALWRKQHP